MVIGTGGYLWVIPGNGTAELNDGSMCSVIETVSGCLSALTVLLTDCAA